MKRLKYLFVLCFLFSLSACGSPTRIYYWEKNNTGSERFVQDHNKCLEKADYWPFRLKNPMPNTPETLDLRLNLKDGGIWANFSPHPGAMPIFVNTAHPSKTLIYWRYSWCMKSAGYKERRPFGGPL